MALAAVRSAAVRSAALRAHPHLPEQESLQRLGRPAQGPSCGLIEELFDKYYNITMHAYVLYTIHVTIHVTILCVIHICIVVIM